jgi:hypothetical protein
LFWHETQQGYQRTWRQRSELASEAQAKIVQLAPAFIGAQGRLVPAEFCWCRFKTSRDIAYNLLLTDNQSSPTFSVVHYIAILNRRHDAIAYRGWAKRGGKSRFLVIETGCLHLMILTPAIVALPSGPGETLHKKTRYSHYLETHQLHCGNAASQYKFLHNIWTTEMKRPHAPPLKVVMDDGAHLAKHMATTLVFWFPRLEPGGLLIMEDVQPISGEQALNSYLASSYE